jgi:hypothetical protein
LVDFLRLSRKVHHEVEAVIAVVALVTATASLTACSSSDKSNTGSSNVNSSGGVQSDEALAAVGKGRPQLHGRLLEYLGGQTLLVSDQKVVNAAATRLGCKSILFKTSSTQ